MTVSRLLEAYHRDSRGGASDVQRLRVVRGLAAVATTVQGVSAGHQAAREDSQATQACQVGGVGTGLGELGGPAAVGGDHRAGDGLGRHQRLRGGGRLVGDLALVHEDPVLGRVGGPVGVTEHARGLAATGHVVHGGRRDLLLEHDRLDERSAVRVGHLPPEGQVGGRVDERVALLTDHLLPDGTGVGDDRLTREADRQPRGLVEVLGVAQVPRLVHGEVDDGVRRLLLRDHLDATELGPGLLVDALVGREPGRLLAVGGADQVALVVHLEEEGLVLGRVLRDHLLGVTEVLPVTTRVLLEPAGVVDVGGRGAVLGEVLRERVDGLAVDDPLRSAVAPPALDGGLLEPAGVVDVGGRGAVLGEVLGERGDVLLGDDLLGVAVLGPAVEGQLLEPAGVVDVGGRGAVLGAELGERSLVLLRDDLVLGDLRPPRGVDVGRPVATVVVLGGVGVLHGLGVKHVPARGGLPGPDRVRLLEREGRSAGVVHRLVADVDERAGRRLVVRLDARDLVRDRHTRTAVGRQVHAARLGDVVRVDAGGGHHAVGQLPPVATEVSSTDLAEPAERTVTVRALGGDLDLLVLDGVDLDGLLELVLLVGVARRLGVLVDHVRLLGLAGVRAGELALVVRDLGLAGVLTGVLVLLVVELLLARVGPGVLELVVRDLLETGHEVVVLPLLVRHLVVAGDGVLELGLVVLDLVLPEQVAEPALLDVGLGGRGDGVPPGRRHHALVLRARLEGGRGGGRAGGDGHGGHDAGAEQADRHQADVLVGVVAHVIPLSGVSSCWLGGCAWGCSVAECRMRMLTEEFPKVLTRCMSRYGGSRSQKHT